MSNEPNGPAKPVLLYRFFAVLLAICWSLLEVYRKGYGSMLDHKLASLPAEANKVHKLITWLEEAFDVSLSFWLSFEKYGSGPCVFWVYAAGSGAVFDHPNFAGLVHRARVVESMENALSSAVWTLLLQLESEMMSLAIPRVGRPTL